MGKAASCARPVASTQGLAGGPLVYQDVPGLSAIRPATTTRLPDGGWKRAFNVPGYYTPIWFVQPPGGFDPESASAAQLTLYGFLHHTPDGKKPRVGHPHLLLPPSLFVDPGATYGTPATGPTVPADSSNWAGYMAMGAAPSEDPPYYDIADADSYYVPGSNGLSSGCGPYSKQSAAVWAGFGGYGQSYPAASSSNPSLVQLGQALYNHGGAQNLFWAELVPAPPVYNGLATPSGALVDFWLSTGPSGANGWPNCQALLCVNFNWMVWNNTTQQWDETVAWTGINNYDGSTAEFITERAASGGTLDNLAQFQAMNWWNPYECGYAFGCTWLTADWPVWNLTMKNGSNVLADNTALSSTSQYAFTTHWHRCQ